MSPVSRHGLFGSLLALALAAGCGSANHVANGVAARASKGGRPVIWDFAWMTEVKGKIAAGEGRYAAALKKLRADADAAMGVGPFSVMWKKLTPPSGDKHDYMSVGPYWWPDPNKPDGLPYIRKDGERNPARNSGDTDNAAESAMAAAVETLGLAYFFTGTSPMPSERSGCCGSGSSPRRRA